MNKYSCSLMQDKSTIKKLIDKEEYKAYKFIDVFDDITSKGRKIKTNDYLEFGDYPIIDQGSAFISGYLNDNVNLLKDLPLIIFGDHTRCLKYVDFPIHLGADGVKVLKNKLGEDKAHTRFLYYYLKNIDIPNTGYNRHFKYLKEILFVLPPLETQKKIVERLDKAYSLIDSRKEQIRLMDELIKSRFVEMFGDPFTNPKCWDVILLKELITNANNGMARRGKINKGEIVLRLVELQDGYIDYSSVNRIELNDTEKIKYQLYDNDFLFARVNGNPNYVGRCAVFKNIDEPVYHNDHIIRVHFNEEVLEGHYTSCLINSDYGKKELSTQIKTSAGQYTISQEGIGQIKAIVPPVIMQRQFAGFIQQINILKSKMQNSLNELITTQQALMQQYFG